MSAVELEDHLALETWEDILNRPEHQPSVDTQKLRTYKVKGIYEFKEEDACCSANACKKNHRRGFLVTYAGSKETNLCEECGQQLLGTSYDEQAKIILDKRKLGQQQMQLKNLLEQSEQIKQRVKELKQVPYGANWLYQSLIGFRQAYPTELLSILTELASNKNRNTIIDARTEGDNTASPLEENEQLEGLGIFNADIKEALIGNILVPLKELEAIVEYPELVGSLSKFCKWAEKIEDHFSFAESLVTEGRLFFTAENMERLKSIPLSEKNAKLTRTLRWDCDKATAKKRIK